MDIGRITMGEKQDESGNEYNGKIINMQKKISDLSNLPLYKTKVIILANVSKKDEKYISRAIGGYDFETYNYEKSYSDLVFPIITSTFYNKKELVIKIKINDPTSSRAKGEIKTSYKECTIQMLLVPVKEVGRIMRIYKNSILRYNPRSFLSLQNNNVNKNIEKAIREIDSNDFALFNNGVTILANEATYSDSTGVKGETQLLLINPQIINGGQTAYTLSQIYEDCERNNNFKIFENKSVILKVITLDFCSEDQECLSLIEKISEATNYQTPVEIQDRISNVETQFHLQKRIYDKYGYFYERKRGEYSEGISKKYITRDLIIDKTDFMRVFIACIGYPNQAKVSSLEKLFSKTNLEKINLEDIERYFYAYKGYEYLRTFKNSWEEDKYGSALRYGKYAVIYATILNIGEHNIENIKDDIDSTLVKWKDFETFAKMKPENKRYLIKGEDKEGNEFYGMNYSTYYRGSNINKDLNVFFDL